MNREKAIEVGSVLLVIGICFGICLIIFTFRAVATPINITQLQKDIQACPYNTTEYRDNEFDCSNMATMLMVWLGLRGYHCDYVIGRLKETGRWHAWLYCDGIMIESTWKDIAWWYYRGVYTVEYIHYYDPTTVLLWHMKYPREYSYPRRW